MRYAVVLDSECDISDSGSISDDHEYQPSLDSTILRNAQVLIEVMDANVRNLEFPFRLHDSVYDEGKMMHAVASRIMGDMRFLSPEFASSKWTPEFRRLLDSCSSIYVETISCDDKRIARNSDRCVVCGTIETASTSIVHLFCESSYSARRFMERPENWAGAFDQYNIDPSEVYQHVCLPCGEVALPAGYKGGFVVGQTCLNLLKRTISAQNFLLDQMVESWWSIHEMGRAGDNYQEVPTLTEFRTSAVVTRIAEIMDLSSPPQVTPYPRLWNVVDASLQSIVQQLGVDRSCIVGQVARHSLQNEPDSGRSNTQDSEDAYSSDNNKQPIAPPTLRRQCSRFTIPVASHRPSRFSNPTVLRRSPRLNERVTLRRSSRLVLRQMK
jgi:hypothetical protein